MEKDCVFCKIGKGEIPSKKIHEDANHFAFLDINPFTKGHTLIIPKKHYETFLDFPENENKEVFALAQKLAKKLKSALNSQFVFLLIMGEEVPHTHVHLIPYYEEMPFSTRTHDKTDLDKVLKQIKEYKGQK